MGLRAAQLRECEAVADLDTLYRLNPHHGRGKPGIEPVFAARVRAETRRNALRAHLDGPAHGVAFRARLVDPTLQLSLVLHEAADEDLDLAQ